MPPDQSLDVITPERSALSVEELLEKDSRYCSYGDTVHYANPPKIFAGCDGSYLFDDDHTPYLDLQMWYSAVNFGYGNRRLNKALKKQIDSAAPAPTEGELTAFDQVRGPDFIFQ